MKHPDTTDLVEYIWKNYKYLIDQETDYLKIVRAKMGVDLHNEPYPEEIKKFKEMGSSKLSLLLSELDNKKEEITKMVCEKYQNKISINTCPQCNKITVTPESKSCLYCQHTWYTLNKNKES